MTRRSLAPHGLLEGGGCMWLEENLNWKPQKVKMVRGGRGGHGTICMGRAWADVYIT